MRVAATQAITPVFRDCFQEKYVGKLIVRHCGEPSRKLWLNLDDQSVTRPKASYGFCPQKVKARRRLG